MSAGQHVRRLSSGHQCLRRAHGHESPLSPTRISSPHLWRRARGGLSAQCPRGFVIASDQISRSPEQSEGVAIRDAVSLRGAAPSAVLGAGSARPLRFLASLGMTLRLGSGQAFRVRLRSLLPSWRGCWCRSSSRSTSHRSCPGISTRSGPPPRGCGDGAAAAGAASPRSEARLDPPAWVHKKEGATLHPINVELLSGAADWLRGGCVFR